MAAVLALSILLSVLVTSIGANRIARRAVARALESSQTAQAAFQQERRGHLRVMARSLGLDPYVTAYAAEAEGTAYASSILHLLEQRRSDFGFGFAIVVDPRGRVVARTDRPGSGGEALAHVPLVAAALQSGEAFGIWEQDGALYDAVAVPLAREATLFGYFVVGFPIDDRQALELKRISGTDVAYVAASGAQPVIVASTLDAGTAGALSAMLQRIGLQSALGSDSQDARRDAGRPLEFDLDGRRWIGLARALQPGEPTGATVALAPLDAELHAFRQIETLLVAAGALALLLALGLSYWLSRRTLQPVRALAAAAAAARRGEFDQQVQIAGGDEVAELGRAFNTLLADLREKRDMELYVADLGRLAAPPAAGGAPASTDLDSTMTLDRSSPSNPVDAGRTATSNAPDVPGPAPLHLQPGALLSGRYEILATLGSGGMGRVLQAYDRDLQEIVALKVLLPEIARDHDMLERLKSEVKLARKITHPNVVRTFDFLELEGVPCISMEYVQGITLRVLLDRSGRLPDSAGLHLARQLGAGLAAAHTEGVIHRDIKPENLVLQPNGNAKLMDFGIARPVQRAGPGQTQAGTVVGTPHYLAPEQLIGDVVDTRADIYACGVLLYEVFTGHLPFKGESAHDIFVKHLRESPLPPRTYWPEMPVGLERILMRCLERAPENRWPSVEDLLEALEELREEVAIRASAPLP